ncbi:hypothetical protein RB5450 [Rhodopirellula baltica SH 1]|uniref:Uncharacterized protein n=1 Tax=Rhodopirellula baltica (strain DSM 10527 / NCIMB 13988 / SH1) TaxID=243090 RepID=Q7URU2_RHOBA|nr:hypothetical protein RB5450 [Rhodopirellula baltica SH 1]
MRLTLSSTSSSQLTLHSQPDIQPHHPRRRFLKDSCTKRRH